MRRKPSFGLFTGRPGTRGLPVMLAGVHDALMARIAEESGFRGIWLSGLGITASHGCPDDGRLPRAEYLERVREVCAAVGLPVLVDVEHGFDSPDVTAELFHEAGAAGICIEDQGGQKRNSFCSGDGLIKDVESFCDILRQVKRTPAGRSLTLVARTESLIVGEDRTRTAERLVRYAEADADALIIHSRSVSGEEVIDVSRSFKGDIPVGVIPTTYCRWTASELGELGVSFVIYANQGLRGIIRSLQELYGEIVRSGSSAAVESRIATMDEVFRIQGGRERSAGDLVPDVGANGHPPR